MPPKLKIVAPIDLHGDAERQAESAVEISRQLSGDLTLLNAVPGGGSIRRKHVSWPEAALSRTSGDMEIHRVTVPGEPSLAIAKYAEFAGADLLVFARTPVARWTRIWKPSVSLKVASNTDRPVLFVRPGTSAGGFCCSGMRILCCLAFDESDGPLLRLAETLARRYWGDLILFSSFPVPSEGLLLEMILDGDRPLSHDVAVERLHRIGTSLQVPSQPIVVRGSPSRGIRWVVAQQAVDLVLASRDAAGAGASLGLRTGDILRRVPVPLLSVTQRYADLLAASITPWEEPASIPSLSTAARERR